MHMMVSLWRNPFAVRLSTWLIVTALIAAIAGCSAAPVQMELTVSTGLGGSVADPGEGAFPYDAGTVVDLVAVPNECYEFVNWTGDAVADPASATTTVIMDAAKSVTANFVLTRYNLIVNSTDGGSVIGPGEGSFSHYCATAVPLMAEAEEGYRFVNWTGDVDTVVYATSAFTTITMHGHCSITAQFEELDSEKLFAGGGGTEEDPYRIADWHHLSNTRYFLGAHYRLMNDLDSATTGYAELASLTANHGKGWQPIGSLLAGTFIHEIFDSVDSFAGSLDGQGHEIRDLFISRPDEDGVGLFGSFEENAVVENLAVVNAEVFGSVYVGLVAGLSDGTVSSCYSTGSVTGRRAVGGLLGWSHGTLSDSYSSSRVTGEWAVGGLVGYSNGGTVTNSNSCGSIAASGTVGGLVGWNDGAVSNSYFGGAVIGDWYVGGLVGEASTWGGSVSNSHYNYDEVRINGKSIITIGALFTESFEQWLANDKFLDVNERLSQEHGYHVIESVSDFKELLAFGQDGSLRFRLGNDLDLAGEPNFYIPYLAGEFDGNGHQVSNVSFGFRFVSNVGLFGYLASGAQVTRVGVEDANITGSGAVGSLVGWNDGIVSNSYSSGGMVQGGSAGGLVGTTYRGTVVDSYARTSVLGDWGVGGLVGWNYYGTVSNSHYNYEEVHINGKNIITAGALFTESFEQWLANDKFLDVNERLSQEHGYYVIENVSDFKELLAFGQDGSLRFRLGNDLDLAGEPNFYIPYLAGEFDGNGHQVSRLSFSFDFVSNVGLFGYLAPGSIVTGVSVENANVTGAGGVGGLVGYNKFGAVSNSYSSGSVTGSWGVGGLAGWNDGTVDNSYSVVTVTGDSRVGGLVGTNGGGVNSSYSEGNVNGREQVGGLVGVNGWGGTVGNCYSSSSVTGERLLGGLVGYNDSSATVSSSFWDMDTSGQATSAGGTGKTTAEMQSIATFSGAGWSIVAIPGADTRNTSYVWNIVNHQDYPFLSWEPVT